MADVSASLRGMRRLSCIRSDLAASGLPPRTPRRQPPARLWITRPVDYGRKGHLFGIIADGLAAALFMTECAIALYEAACRGPGGRTPGEPSYVRAMVAAAVSWSNGYRRAGGHRLFTANDREPTGIARFLSGV